MPEDFDFDAAMQRLIRQIEARRGFVKNEFYSHDGHILRYQTVHDSTETYFAILN